MGYSPYQLVIAGFLNHQQYHLLFLSHLFSSSTWRLASFSRSCVSVDSSSLTNQQLSSSIDSSPPQPHLRFGWLVLERGDSPRDSPNLLRPRKWRSSLLSIFSIIQRFLGWFALKIGWWILASLGFFQIVPTAATASRNFPQRNPRNPRVVF